MQEDDNKEVKTIDVNDDNFFTDTDSYFEKNAKTPNDGFISKLVIIAVILSFLLIILVVAVPLDKINGLKFGSAMFGHSAKEQTGFDLFKSRENILFLGVDSNGDDTDKFKGTRTDTIMITSLDRNSRSVNVLSIPRDSKVYIGGHGTDKINAAHAVGGIDLTIKTIEEMFGIKIDHYVLVDYDGLKEIVKILGTIPVTVEKKLRYKDYAGHLFVNLDPGVQELDANQVEQFARFRHDAVGDIGRMERQRMLMKGIITKIQSPESIAKLPEIISTTSKYVKTDMTFFDMTRYAGIAKSINIDDVVVATLPGHPSQNSYISYWILEPDKVQKIIDRLVYRIENADPKASPLKVSLLYDSATGENLDAIKTLLAENNMEVVCEKKTKKSVSEVIAHTDNITATKYKYLKNLLPQLKKAPMSIEYDMIYCADSDATLIMTAQN